MPIITLTVRVDADNVTDAVDLVTDALADAEINAAVDPTEEVTA